MDILFRFDGESPSPAWAAVNDGVMGGVSEGGAHLAPVGMVFRGRLSLENNGGFASVRQPVRADLSGYEGIRLKVRGDGRPYQLRLETDERFRGWSPVSFSGTFATVANEWAEVFIPFRDLGQTWRGRQLSGYTFDPARIRLIGLLLADKQPGPFKLEVAWIAAVRGNAEP